MMTVSIRPHRLALWAALALVALLAVCLPLSACGGGGAVDAKTALAQCSSNMKKIAGFHFVYEVHNPANYQPKGGFEIRRIIGDVNSQGDMSADVTLASSSVPSYTIQFIQIGTDQYAKAIGIWQKISGSSSPIGQVNLKAGTIRILDQIASIKYVGRENKAGADCYHLSGKVAAAEVSALAGSVTTKNPFPTDLWIGVNDLLIYEVDIKGQAQPDENPQIWRSVVLSKQGQSKTINAPK